MKSLLITLAVCMVAGYTFAQNNSANERFIEVTVSDTVIIVPDEFIYFIQVSSSEYSDYGDMPSYEDYDAYMAELERRQQEAKVKMEIADKKLRDFLTKEKIAFEKAGEQPNEITPYPMEINENIETESNDMPYGYRLKFKSAAQIRAFQQKIPDDIKYRGEVIAATCSNPKAFEEKLLKKLITHAQEQAVKIASLSGVKLGPLQQYSDNMSEVAKGIQESIQALIKESKRRYDQRVNPTSVLSKTVRFRFSIS